MMRNFKVMLSYSLNCGFWGIFEIKKIWLEILREEMENINIK